MMNSFYIQKSLATTSYDLKICDYALLDRKVENSNPVVAFLTGILANKRQDTKKLKKDCFMNMKNNLSNYPTEMNESFRITRNPKRKK